MRAKHILNTEYDGSKAWHNLALLFVVVLCLILCAPVLRNAEENIEYPLDSVRNAIPYVQQFDAFMKGQAELDVTPDARLAELENPYSPEEREEIPFLWDRAYYNGQYYSYFGIAPILTVYFPYYVFTGALPSAVTVCFILAAFSVVFTALAFREVILRFCPHAKLYMVLAALFAVIFGGGLYAGLSWSDNYYIAVLSAIQNSMAFIFFAMRGMRTESLSKRCVLFAVSAVCLTLTVWSRPTAALMCLALAPLILDFFIKAFKENIRSALASAVSFLGVLTVGAGLVMYFNAVRFSSPLDFGAAYQLTVSDISENKISFSLFGEAMTAYFLQLPSIMERFPFVTRSYLKFDAAGRYIYTASSVGAFSFGLPAASLLAPFAARIKEDKARFLTFVSVIVLSVLLAFSDFCLGGVNLRYLLDFLPILTLFSASGLLILHGRTKGATRAVVTAAAFLLFCMASLMVLGIIIGNGKDFLCG